MLCGCVCLDLSVRLFVCLYFCMFTHYSLKREREREREAIVCAAILCCFDDGHARDIDGWRWTLFSRFRHPKSHGERAFCDMCGTRVCNFLKDDRLGKLDGRV